MSTLHPPSIGRNDPCPCGSGKKYKKCCMDEAGAAGPPAAVEKEPSKRELLAQARKYHIEGQHEAAHQLYLRVLEADPRDPDALCGVGLLQGQARNFEEGIRYLRRAIEVNRKHPAYHSHLAGQLLASGDAARASVAVRRALALQSEDAFAWTILAKCQESANDLEEAARSLRRAFAIDPSAIEPEIVMARIERRRKDLQGAIARLRRLAERARATAHMPQIWHELGMALDGAGEYDDAFDAFMRYSATRASMPDARRFAPNAGMPRLENYRAALSAELFRRFRRTDFEDDWPAPTFLVGFPRSGTTLTEQVMAAHPGIVTTEESEILFHVKLRLEEIVAGEDDLPFKLARLERGQVLELRRLYWELARKAVGSEIGARKYVDKMPLQITDAGLINVVFPEAQLLVALRDPRDVCLSCFMQDFALNVSMVHFLSLEDTARFYDAVMGNWLAVRDDLSLEWIEVRYEDTVVDLEGQARRVLAFLGAEWDPVVLAFHERARKHAISTPSYAAVTEPVYTRARGRWNNYARHLEPIAGQLAPYVRAFGYEE